MRAEETLTVRVLDDFDDLSLDGAGWDGLLSVSSTDVPFLTLAWQREWWRAFGGDRLLIAVAEQDGKARAIAPLFALDEMLFLVGSGGSDYLDFIGSYDAATLAAMLDAARGALPQFAGISVFHLPGQSRTTRLLEDVAERLDLELFREGEMRAPYLDLTDPEAVRGAIDRKKRRQEESKMRRDGPLEVRTAGPGDLDQWLEQFFAQHEARWTPEGEPGLARADARSFCRAVVHAGHRQGWLRFSMLEWCGRAAAFDITLTHGDRYLSYLVSRDASITGYSPGNVLERHVIRRAVESGARRFDLGLGEEEYKLRHASGLVEVANWSLYP